MVKPTSTRSQKAVQEKGKALFKRSVLVGIAIASAVALAQIVRRIIQHDGDLSQAWLIVLLAGVTFGLMHFRDHWKYSKKTLDLRLQAADPSTRLSEDRRLPILYLRSFEEDMSAQSKLDGSSEVEVQLRPLLEEFGPVVAIGHPGDELPPLGAARLYVDDKQWRTTVTDMMKEAQLVVVQVGTTEGLLWELETTIEHVPPERLLISLPFDKGAAKREEIYAAFRNCTVSLFPRPLPRQLNGGIFVTFGPKWGPILLKSSRWHPVFKRPDIYKCLRPFLERRLKKAGTTSSG